MTHNPTMAQQLNDDNEGHQSQYHQFSQSYKVGEDEGKCSLKLLPLHSLHFLVYGPEVERGVMLSSAIFFSFAF